MAKFELKLPKMGESVAEATITSWLKEVGDTIEMDEPVLEIATDKVDSEVPSEVDGKLVEKLFEADEVVKVGQVIAIIETDGEVEGGTDEADEDEQTPPVAAEVEETVENAKATASGDATSSAYSNSSRFYSPLVKNIAKQENISLSELEKIVGTGKEGRVTKNDIIGYVENRGSQPQKTETSQGKSIDTKGLESKVSKQPEPVVSGEDEIREMSRMGKMIAHHMVDSVQKSAHVQSFIEVDVTNIVLWRNNIKDKFQAREHEKITYTPIFMLAVAKAIKAFPMINIAVKGDKIIKKKAINLGMAAALEDGNLIVPVIKNADLLSLVGMTKAVNDLAGRARKGALNPDDIQGGTYTVTNVGSFGSAFGTPIINQPQVGILALGAVRKVPAVIETPEGDFIGIRHKMFITHSYDHRVVNGALGGMFIKAIKESLEAWDVHADF